ncbi:MAG: ThuA domain-containing protein, partial [Bacteroidota bacterium]|nr:ThuA domain-containing protein [Bacteroidota bacterium]
MKRRRIFTIFVGLFINFFLPGKGISQKNDQSFKVIAFYTAREDQAHISFVHEANT